MAALADLTHLELQDNTLSGSVLPAFDFSKLHKSCFLKQAFGDNRFACPWPAGATKACLKVNANNDYVPITDKDCHGTAPPPSPPPATYKCSDGQCILASGGVSQPDCASICLPQL